MEPVPCSNNTFQRIYLHNLLLLTLPTIVSLPFWEEEICSSLGVVAGGCIDTSVGGVAASGEVDGSATAVLPLLDAGGGGCRCWPLLCELELELWLLLLLLWHKYGQEYKDFLLQKITTRFPWLKGIGFFPSILEIGSFLAIFQYFNP